MCRKNKNNKKFKRKYAKQRKKGRKHDSKDLENKGNWEDRTICGMGKKMFNKCNKVLNISKIHFSKNSNGRW